VLIFALHARKRGWATQILPPVEETRAVPDLAVRRGDQVLFVEVELGQKESPTKWRNQAKLNGSKVALCAATPETRQRLAGDCRPWTNFPAWPLTWRHWSRFKFHDHHRRNSALAWRNGSRCESTCLAGGIDTGHQPDKQNLSNRNAETETSVKAPTHAQMGAIIFLRPTVAGTRHFFSRRNP